MNKQELDLLLMRLELKIQSTEIYDATDHEKLLELYQTASNTMFRMMLAKRAKLLEEKA